MEKEVEELDEIKIEISPSPSPKNSSLKKKAGIGSRESMFLEANVKSKEFKRKTEILH